VPDILIASDAEWLLSEVIAVVAGSGTAIRTVRSGPEVRLAVQQRRPDLVISDLQIGNMGGIAVAMDLRLEEGAGRTGHTAILLLLDRRADVFLARRSGADGWLIKPLDPIRLRRAVKALLAGEQYFDESYLPNPVTVAPESDTLSDSGK
jgi:DNA-binding response OmpR family regulator